MRNFGTDLNQGNHVHLDTELLSAYIDGEVTPDEATRVEQHLPTCRHCADELESLRWTVNLLREVPPIPVPRSFAVRLADLEPEPARRRRPLPNWLLNGLQWATAATAALMMLLIAADFLNLGQPEAPAALMQAAQSESAAAPMAAGESRALATEKGGAPLAATVQTEREEVVELSGGPQEAPALTIVPEEGRAPLLLKPEAGEPSTQAYVNPVPKALAQPEAPPRAAEDQAQAEALAAESPAGEAIPLAPPAGRSFDRLRSAEIGLAGLFIVLLGLTVWARRR
ncbi:MAG: anti-sigma factor family protein [Anaerolineae bacterium]